MSLVRPRLTDFHGIPLTQESVDFAIPFLDEDIPLYLDPFLLWKSPSMQDQALHNLLISSFNHLGYLYKNIDEKLAVEMLIQMSECSEVGLGTSKNKKGKKISKNKAVEILELFINLPQVGKDGFTHIESIQLLIDGISRDRISDIGCNILKSFLIDFTQDICNKCSIPMMSFNDVIVFNTRERKLHRENVKLPYSPLTNQPIIFVPKRWLRYLPWINFEDYFKACHIEEGKEGLLERPEVLKYNRANYDMVLAYLSQKERIQSDCKNDPLFRRIPIVSAKRTLNSILKLPTGKTENADMKFEDYSVKLLASLLYPHLDFAQEQSRTDSGTQIRDLIFYNNCDYPLLKTIYNEYDCKQIVIEMKNVKEVSRDHVNQLNRYLSNQFGSFGIILTRNALKKSIYKNTIDLWSGQRKMILCMTDEDLKLMVNVYETKQRDPIEVLNRLFVEFTRQLPN